MNTQKYVWKVAKRATNFQDVYLPEGAIYKTFPEKIIKGKHCPAMCIYCTDFAGLKKREHITIIKIIDGQRMKPEYVDADKAACKGIKAFAATLNLDAIKVKPAILRRDIAPIAPRDRKVGAYIQKPRRDNTSCFEGDFVTNRCKVGARLHSEEMYEYAKMGMKTPSYSGIPEHLIPSNRKR